MTGERILDQAINSRIALQEARRLGLTASDAEVRDLIAKQFSDPSTGFDYKRYSDYVVRSYGSVPLYEQSVRDALAAQKLRSYVTAGVQVSEAEVKDDFMRDNTAFDVTYVPVNAQDLAEKLAPSDDEMRQYFDAHQTDYRLLEPQKKIRYLFVSQDKVGQKLSISDEDLHKEYDSLKPENKMAGVRVQQIVLRVARPELDQEILAKATGLVTKIRGEDLTATEEAFADLARGNSEDPSTAKGGGWLPNPVKKNPNRKTNAGAPGNAAELAQNTLEWKEGQVGDPLKTGNAYYVFRRGPVVPKTFEDAKQELLVSLRNRRSYAAAQAVAQKAQERLRESHDVAKTAQEFAAEANMSPAEMTKETGFVRPGDDVPDIGSSPQFEDAIKPLEEPNQVGDRVGVKNGFAIPMLAEKRDPRVPEFDEVRDRVATDLKRARAGEQLEQTARDLATNSASPDALKAAAGKLGLKPQDEEGFHLGRPLGTAGADPAIDSAVYALKVGETTKTPVKVGETWVVLGVTKRDDAKTEDFDKRKSQLVETAINERREQVFDEFLTSARRRLEEKGDIQINRDTLAQLEEAEAPPTAVPPRAPITIPPQGK
jgi:peptidyl-prolyl cis-trans isomerase D